MLVAVLMSLKFFSVRAFCALVYQRNPSRLKATRAVRERCYRRCSHDTYSLAIASVVGSEERHIPETG